MVRQITLTLAGTVQSNRSKLPKFVKQTMDEIELLSAVEKL